MKIYTIQFGSGTPTGFSGLSPTMLIFYNLATSATIAPPSITESPVGWGTYTFQYGTTQPIWFLADAATTSPGTVGRYVSGVLDPSDRADEYGNSLVAIGTTGIALGTTSVALGTTSVAIGTTIAALGTTAVAQGTTGIAIGTTLTSLLNGLSSGLLLSIGSTASQMGNTSTMPVDLFGYLRRIDGLLEGQSQFYKGSNQLTLYDLTGATALMQRTLTNNTSLVTKI